MNILFINYSFVKHFLYKVQGSFTVNPTIYATYTEHWNYITERPTQDSAFLSYFKFLQGLIMSQTM